MDPKITASRNLRFFAYYIRSNYNLRAKTQYDKHTTPKLFGNSSVPDVLISKNPEEIKKHYEEMETKRETLKYDIDGMVIKVNDLETTQGTRRSWTRDSWMGNSFLGSLNQRTSYVA